MKKGIIKLFTFIGVFLISLVAISFFMNKGNADMTAQMGPATLPTVSIGMEGMQINRMYGYCTAMETAGMRESITPLGKQRQVDACIHTYGQEINGASYEVRSVDGSRLIENTPLTDFRRSGEDLYVSFRLKDLIEEGSEYSLIFVIELKDGRQARYYTRVIQAEYYLAEKLEFITGFSDATFDYDEMVEKGYSRKLEPNSEGNNASLNRVNIHSTARQVAWGGIAVKKESGTQIQIREIAPQTASVTLSYLVSFPDGGKTSYAWTEEYFRVRYTVENMYLLDYERTVEQFLNETAGSFANDKLRLGITDPQVQMMESDGGTVFAFSNAGALYSYNGADGKLARLFSFYEEDANDERSWNNSHGFEILHVDETGNVVFLVYGYMNRGRHEGLCGVQVCYYSSPLNVVEEMAFIPYTKSADILKADMENLSYVNGKNDLYLMLNGSIYHIGLEDKSSQVLAEGLSENSYCVSQDGSMLAYQKGGSSDRILVLMNLNSGEKDEIDAGEGNAIRPLGFMGEDLIYGIASGEDIWSDVLGYTFFPMKQILIRNFAGDVLKRYEEEGFYVTACSIEGNQIYLERVQKEENGFQGAGSEQILYSDEIPASKNYVVTAVTEELQTIVQIALRSAVDTKKVKVLTPKEVLFEGSRDILLTQEKSPERYYVYGKDGVVDILSVPADAAALAYENAGSVTADDGSYVFKRDRLHTSNQIMAIKGMTAENGESSLAVCLNAIFRFEGLMRDSAYLLESGKNVMTILEENLDGRKILNLQGCTLDMVLYYPDREIPVLAVLEDGNAVLITGFNEQNVVLMDPLTGKVYKKGINDSRTWFEENKNRFIAYW